jgi:hypothetical protein
MRSFILHTVAVLTLWSLPLGDAEAQRRCTRGKPCGNTCIAQNRTCHVGTPSATPTQEPTPRSAPTSPPVRSTPAPAPTQRAPSTPPATTPAPTDRATVATAVDGYYAIDSIEAREVAEARARALARRDAARRRSVDPGGDLDLGVDAAEDSALEAARIRSRARSAPPQEAARPRAPANAGDALWVASRRGRTYYKAGCSGANALSPENRIYFRTEAEAQAAGLTRSRTSGC